MSAEVEDDGYAGFEPGPDGGRVCPTCRCLVRSTRGDVQAHLAWHESLGQ